MAEFDKSYARGTKAKQIRNMIEKVAEEEKQVAVQKNGTEGIRPINENMDTYGGYWSALVNLPVIDIENRPAVKRRCEEYLRITCEYGMKPAITQLATALGISRSKLYNIHNRVLRTFPEKTAEVIDRYYNLIDGATENLIQDGKLPVVWGIFQGKNSFGYKDQVEVIASNNVQREMSPDELIREARMLQDDGEITGEGTIE